MRTLALTLFLTILVACPARAQEVQVPLDESGTLLVIDQTTENFEEIFPEFRGFREARLFRISEDAYVLEVLYQPGADVLRERRELTASEVQALRARVSAAIPVPDGRATLDQSGRPRLLRQAALSSLFLYGPALPVALDVEDEGVASGLYLATASAGFFIPFFATRRAPVTQGAATLSRVGAAQGALHGLTLPLLISGGDMSGRAVYGLTALGSAVEAIVGYHLATRRGTGRGEAEVIGNGGLFGSIFGLSLGGLLSVTPEGDPDPIDDGSQEDAFDDDFFETNTRIFSGATLVGSLAGLYAGHALAQRETYTRGDARVLATTGFLGVNAGFLATDLSDTQNGRVASALLATGTLAGVAAGHLLTTGRDFTAAQGAYVGLAAIAGGLGGLAVGAMLDAAPTPAYTLGTAGSILGFSLMYAAFRNEARTAAESRTMGALEFNVNPAGVLGALRGDKGRVGVEVFRIGLRV